MVSPALRLIIYPSTTTIMMSHHFTFSRVLVLKDRIRKISCVRCRIRSVFCCAMSCVRCGSVASFSCVAITSADRSWFEVLRLWNVQSPLCIMQMYSHYVRIKTCSHSTAPSAWRHHQQANSPTKHNMQRGGRLTHPSSFFAGHFPLTALLRLWRSRGSALVLLHSNKLVLKIYLKLRAKVGCATQPPNHAFTSDTRFQLRSPLQVGSN